MENSQIQEKVAVTRSLRVQIHKLPRNPFTNDESLKKGMEGCLVEGDWRTYGRESTLTLLSHEGDFVIAEYEIDRGVGGTVVPSGTVVRLPLGEYLAFPAARGV